MESDITVRTWNTFAAQKGPTLIRDDAKYRNNSQDMINKGQASQAKSSWEYTMYKALITGQWIMRKPPVFANGQLFSSWSTPENSWSGNISLIPLMREPESLWVNQQDIWIFHVDLQITKFQKTAYLVIIPPILLLSIDCVFECLWKSK